MAVTVWKFLVAHQTTVALIAFYMWSSFVGALPSPKVDSGMFYQFMFKFLNTLGGNLSRAFSGNLPVAAAQAQGVAVAVAQDKVDKAAAPPKP